MRARRPASTPAGGRRASARPAPPPTATPRGPPWTPPPPPASICLNRGRAPHRHGTRLYERVARRKGHQKAIGAVARHLAEATYWVLTKQEFYREPQPTTVSSTGDKRG